MADTDTIPLLAVQGLTVEFETRRGAVRAVEQIDLTVAKAETLGELTQQCEGLESYWRHDPPTPAA